MRPRGGDLLRERVEEQCVREGEGSGAGSCSMCAQVGLCEGDREGGVRREVEGGIALAPVSRGVSNALLKIRALT